MLKPEFIRSLKKNNISANPEKTMERIRSVWQPLKRPVREEILSLAAMKKVSVERAYKTGGASAKVILSIAQVLGIDPHYLTGESDKQGTFSNEIAIKFLTSLGYGIGKSDIGRRRRAKPEIESANATDSEEESTEAAKTLDLRTISMELSKLLSNDVKNKLNDLTDDDIILLLKSLSVQAGFNEDKRNRLVLIKCMLLL